jgi:hypothetical protein
VYCTASKALSARSTLMANTGCARHPGAAVRLHRGRALTPR